MARSAAAPKDQTLWEHRWQELSRPAREAVLVRVFIPYYDPGDRPVSTPAYNFEPTVLQELVKTGWMTTHSRQKGIQDVSCVPEALPFICRMQRLARARTLRTRAGEGQLHYWLWDGEVRDVEERLYRVLKTARLGVRPSLAHLVQDFVTLRIWPDWVLQHLHLPLATQLFQAIAAKPEPIRLGQVATLLPGTEAAEVRVVLRDLVSLLALFEDLEPNTFELMIGLLPVVRQAREKPLRAGRPGPLCPSAEPGMWLPPSGYLVEDLRAVLLELSGQPARLKNDGSIYARELPRFEQRLAELPAELLPAELASRERRAAEALGWARLAGFTDTQRGKGESWFHLAKVGRRWLSLALADQYRALFDFLQSQPPRHSALGYAYRNHDGFFLGTSTVAVRGASKTSESGATLSDRDREELRTAFLRAFRELPEDAFVTLGSFLDHVSAGSASPFALEADLRQVGVYVQNRRLPPVAEVCEEAARAALLTVIEQRLAPLGCVLLGCNEAGQRVLRRQPRLDAFFGKALSDQKLGEAGGEHSRVIVQPDFSVFVIGLNTSAAADLTPFCERVPGSVTPGSLHLKLTRTAVIRGVLQTGLSGEALVGLLGKHSSVAVPANVAHEVREWSGLVREVSATLCTVLRCPDAATAERVRASLGTIAVVIGETFVAVPGKDVPAAARRKLLAEGVNVQTAPLTADPVTRKTTRRKRP